MCVTRAEGFDRREGPRERVSGETGVVGWGGKALSVEQTATAGAVDDLRRKAELCGASKACGVGAAVACVACWGSSHPFLVASLFIDRLICPPNCTAYAIVELFFKCFLLETEGAII